MACPFFLPTEEFTEWAWHARPRLPLGDAWKGTCTAPRHQGESPTPEMLKEWCNFGYAKKCPWIPPQRHADKIGLSIARDKEDIILIYYVFEVDHTPGEHGTLQYDNQQGRWLKSHSDARLQKQAQCYLESYLKRKQTPVRPGHPLVLMSAAAHIAKPVCLSQAEMTELVLPNDANMLGNILGGKVMHLVDLCGAIAASRHSGCVAVTASIDHMDFRYPVKIGELVILKASVNRVFNTSMEVGVKVFSESMLDGERRHTSSAYLTFVALDPEGNRHPVPPVLPETDDERRRYDQAGHRRAYRLSLRQSK